MKKVLAEIDQETDVIDELALETRAGDEVRQGDGGAHQPLETAEEDH